MNRSYAALSIISATSVIFLTACGGGGSAPIEGTVSGLGTGLSVTLQDNGTDTLTVSSNGQFAFADKLAGAAAYNVTILTQPPGQVCELTNGSGAVDAGGDTVTSVAVACVNTSSVGGTVTGLAAGAAVTLSNGTVLLPLATNGPFAFPGLLTEGTLYQVAVATQPIGQTCTVLNGVGSVTSSASTPITVTCT